jgi:hypothetical protein
MTVYETRFDHQAQVPDHGLCLPHVPAEEAVALWDELVRDLRPRSAVERIVVDQMYRSELSARQCCRLRASLQKEKIRKADTMWQHARQDEVEACRNMLPTDAATAVMGLRRFAAGARFMVAEWTTLQSFLDQDGTLYGNQRRMAIHLLGFSAEPYDVYHCDDAYIIWRYCFEAQKAQDPRDEAILNHVDVIPKRFREQPPQPWPPTPEFSRAQLQALIDRELTALLALADELQVTEEQPSRAAARDQVLASDTRKETQLLREQQGHERGFQQAAATLAKLRRQPQPDCTEDEPLPSPNHHPAATPEPAPAPAPKPEPEPEPEREPAPTEGQVATQHNETSVPKDTEKPQSSSALTPGGPERLCNPPVIGDNGSIGFSTHDPPPRP